MLTLKTFSATGGIEKVCRVAGKAFAEESEIPNGTFSLMSMHDKRDDAKNNRYFNAKYFKGFGAAKIRFMIAAIRAGASQDMVILSHVNLLPAAWIIKKIKPSVKTILFAHGIEIWQPFHGLKRKMLQSCDHIISVSKFTSDQVQAVQKIGRSRLTVLNNCLDPFLPPPAAKTNEHLREKYGLKDSDRVLLILTRLAATERYKGYDKVISAIAGIQKKSAERICYLMAGKYTLEEKAFIEDAADSAGIGGQVVLTGYVADEALADHFRLAEVYIMPSKKEGFGIVFIEALYYGLPVIAGNKDGSVDALAGGALGTLVDPDDIEAIREAIEKVLANKQANVPDRELLTAKFGYDTYKASLYKILDRVCLY